LVWVDVAGRRGMACSDDLDGGASVETYGGAMDAA
jgi:hypothetical protein